jgi:hypothetical protein
MIFNAPAAVLNAREMKCRQEFSHGPEMLHTQKQTTTAARLAGFSCCLPLQKECATTLACQPQLRKHATQSHKPYTQTVLQYWYEVQSSTALHEVPIMLQASRAQTCRDKHDAKYAASMIESRLITNGAVCWMQRPQLHHMSRKQQSLFSQKLLTSGVVTNQTTSPLARQFGKSNKPLP